MIFPSVGIVPPALQALSAVGVWGIEEGNTRGYGHPITPSASCVLPGVVASRYKQNLRKSRRNGLPTERIERRLVECPEHAARALIEVLEVGKTASGSDAVLPQAPEACKRIEVVTAPGWQTRQAQACVPVGEGRRERVRSVDAPAVSVHADLCAGRATGGHHFLDLLATPCGITRRDDLLADFGCTLWPSPNETAYHPAGDPAPGAIAYPGVPLDGLVAPDLAQAPGACGQASAWRLAPPSLHGEGQAPQ